MNFGKQGGLLLLAALALSAGCASMNTVQTANTLGNGKLQLGLEPAISGVKGDAFNGMPGGIAIGPSSQPAYSLAPRADVSLRYGVSDTVDLGGRIGYSGLELTSKFLLSDPANKSTMISVAPALGGGILDVLVALNLQVPVLFGFEVSEGSQLILGPKVAAGLAYAGVHGGGWTSWAGLGGSVGYAVSISQGFRILPELGFLYPLSFPAGQGFGPGVQFSLGLLFGG